MMGSAPPEVTVLPFSWRKALFGKYDVLHVHWPEYLLRGSGPAQTVVKRVFASLLLIRVAAARKPVVRTVHNVAPHEGVSPIERFLVGALERSTSTSIVLNPTTPVTTASSCVIPHGHYRDAEAFRPRGTRVDGALLYFGLIREYKGLDDLVDAYERLSIEGSSLRVVGKPRNPQLIERITAYAEQRSDVSVRFGYLSDLDLAAEIGRSSVVVLPYRAMHNSGAMLLALSMGRTVLAPRTPSTQLVQDEVGANWLQLYDGDRVRETDLALALATSSMNEEGLTPKFERRDRETIGRAHLEVYRSVMRSRGDARAEGPFTTPNIDYLVGGVRISLDSESNTPGPRTHILNFLGSAEKLGISTRVFLASSYPLLGRFRAVEQTHYQNVGSAKTVGVDVIRVVLMVWAGVVTLVRSSGDPDIIYERSAVFQSLSSFHRCKGRAVRVVEANGILSRETARDRNISRAEWLSGAIEKHVLRSADIVVAVSEALGRELEQFAGIPSDKILVVPNGLDTELLARSRLPSDHFVFGFVGSVVRWHDLPTIVTAICRHLVRSGTQIDGRPVRVEVIGTGPALDGLKDLVRDNGWDSAVIFHGKLPQTDALGVMSGWDVGIAGHRASSSSTMYHSPLKLYEYAGLGLEILCTPSEDARRLRASGAYVHMYESEDDLIRMVTATHNFGRSRSEIEDSRRAVGADHSWENRVEMVTVAASAVRR